MPFRAETVGKLKKCILDGTYYLPEFLTDRCRFLLRNILRPVATDRFTMEEIKHSAWLEGELFPRPDTKYSLCPRGSEGSDLSEDERLALNTMKELGISSEHFAKCRDSRDSITGTYRVVLHRITRKNLEVIRKTSTLSTYSNNNHLMVDSRPHKTESHERGAKTQPKSKFCIILWSQWNSFFFLVNLVEGFKSDFNVSISIYFIARTSKHFFIAEKQLWKVRM